MWHGPIPQSTLDRQVILNRIVADLQRIYQDRIVLIALYGSMARGDDLPYSDIELFCVLKGDEEVDFSREWVYGAGKAEVNILSEDVARADAALLDDDWARWKGQFTDARLLGGDPEFLDELRELVFSAETQAFNTVIEEMIAGELYEWIGKLRNAQAEGNNSAIPVLACHFVEHLAQILGLAHRRCYTTSSHTLSDSLRLPRRPAGYDALCGLVRRGELQNPRTVASHIESCWAGLAEWSKKEDLHLASDGSNIWPTFAP